MLAHQFLLALLASAGPAVDAHAEIYLTEDQALKIAFPGADAIEKQLVAFTSQQQAAIETATGRKDPPRIFRYFVGRKSGEVLGYVAIEDCMGKSEPITYMVATDPALSIRAVEILAYRESRGGEVRQEGWRRQFAGKDPASPVRVGSDIRNIAGATISCRSVTDGIRLQLACLSVATRRDRSTAQATAQPAGPFRRARISMGTSLEIAVYAAGEREAREALDAAFAEVERLDRILSTFIEDSETSRLNRSAGGEFLSASPELLDLLARSREICARTGGAFDVSVGPLVALWRHAAEAGAPPHDEEIRAARQAAGPGAVETDPEHGRARLVRAGAALDFGGIGKGYALDRAAAALEGQGVHRAVLDFGGQVLALDPPPGEKGWKVEVRDAARPESMRASVLLSRASISTTADYERGMEIAGRRVSHVVDPRTGRPVEGMLGASVVCATATEADALSTAIYVLGPKAGADLAAQRGIAALVVPAEGLEVENDAFRKFEIRNGEAR
jgi:thiamine biosynthesis lipoprotein